MDSNDLNQLADAVVDWAGVDINNLLQNWEPNTERDQATPAAREFIKCLLWTLSQEPEARRCLQSLTTQAQAEWRFRG
jgi:hypothetical protein